MNKERRKKVVKLFEQIESALIELEEIKNEEEEALENLPDNLRESGKADEMQEIVDELDNCFTDLEEVRSRLEEIINR